MSAKNSKKKNDDNNEVEIVIDHSPKKEQKPAVVDNAGIKDGGLRPFNEELVKDINEANQIDEIQTEQIKNSQYIKQPSNSAQETNRNYKTEDELESQKALEQSRSANKYHPNKSVIGTTENVTGIEKVPTIYADKKAKKISNNKPNNQISSIIIAIPVVFLIVLFIYILYRYPDVISDLVDNIKTLF